MAIIGHVLWSVVDTDCHFDARGCQPKSLGRLHGFECHESLTKALLPSGNCCQYPCGIDPHAVGATV